MRPPVAAAEIAAASILRLPVQARADASVALSKKIADRADLTPDEVSRVRSILAAGDEHPGAVLARALVGGKPMERALAAAAPDDVDDGIMVAFLPADPDRLVLPGGLAGQDLHVTATYSGTVSELGERAPVIRTVMRAAFEEWAAKERPMLGLGTHRSRLGPDGEALVLEVDSDDLRNARRRLVAAFDVYGLPWANRYLYRPHVTLSYLEPGDEAETGPVDVPELLYFDRVIFSFGSEDLVVELAAPVPGPNVTAAAGKTDPWPHLNSAIAGLLEAWETIDDRVRADLVATIDFGWRTALERVGRSMIKAAPGKFDRSTPLLAIAASGLPVPSVNARQIVSSTADDVAAAVARTLAGTWTQALADIDETFAVLFENQDLTILDGWIADAVDWARETFLDLVLDRLAGPAGSVYLADEPALDADPGASPAFLVADVLAIASGAPIVEVDGLRRARRDEAGRPLSEYDVVGSDGLLSGPAGLLLIDAAIDAWADYVPGSVTAEGRRKAGARISLDLRNDLADAADAAKNLGIEPGTEKPAAYDVRGRPIGSKPPVQRRRKAITTGTWTLEMNGRISTQHEPQHEALAGTEISVEGELFDVDGAAADPSVWPYVPVRRPGDHRYCKCGWKTRTRYVVDES